MAPCVEQGISSSALTLALPACTDERFLHRGHFETALSDEIVLGGGPICTVINHSTIVSLWEPEVVGLSRGLFIARRCGGRIMACLEKIIGAAPNSRGRFASARRLRTALAPTIDAGDDPDTGPILRLTEG
jgi:hypothetical protein